MQDNIKEILKSAYPDSVLNEGGNFLQFSLPEEELQNIFNSGVIRLYDVGQIFTFSGKDTIGFFNRISTNNIQNLTGNHLTETLFLNEKGRIIDKNIIYYINNYLRILPNKGNEERLERWISKFIIEEDVVFSKDNDVTILNIFGLNILPLMILLFGTKIEFLENNEVQVFQFNEFYLEVLRTDYSNKIFNFYLIVKNNNILELLNKLLEYKSTFKNSFIGEIAYNLFRIKNKIPVYPNELNLNNLPTELELTDLIDTAKGCYIGQEIIARLISYSNKTIGFKYFECIGDLPADISENVYFGDKIVGRITSISHFIDFNKSCAGLMIIELKYCENNSINELYLKNNYNKFKINLIN